MSEADFERRLDSVEASVAEKSAAAAAAASASAKPSQGTKAKRPLKLMDLGSWKEKICKLQKEKISPEQRKKLQLRAAQQARRAKMSKKAKRLGAASAMSAKTWHRNQTEVNTVLQTLRRTSDEQEDESTRAQKIGLALKEGRAARQSKSVNVMNLVSAAAGAVFNSAASLGSGSSGYGAGEGGGGAAAMAFDEIEEMAQFRSVLAADREMAADLAEVEAAMDAGVEDAVDVVNETDFEKAVSELRVEPKDDEERKEKFKLYEDYAATVEKVRAETIKFYEDSKSEFEGGAGLAMERKIKGIDSEENMGAFFQEGGPWFVLPMIKKAFQNNKSTSGILDEMRRKLELLAAQPDCPVCLEKFDPSIPELTPVVLGCCHKVCAECWANWKRVARGRTTCPLCRNVEFLSIMGVAVD